MLRQLVESPDRATRGLAKRLSAVLMLNRAQRDAAGLLDEACHDLDFRYPVVVNEALGHAAAIGDANRLFELRVAAAEAFSRRKEHARALIQLLSAAAVDFQNNALHLNEPASLRRLIAVYEAVAAESMARVGVQPAPRGVRRSPAAGRLRMAHVTCQLVDHGHSPSRAIHTLLKHADRERFETHLFITEALGLHDERDGQATHSPWTPDRAPELIGTFVRDFGVPVHLPRTRVSHLAAAADLHAQMAEARIDVAFFHGSIATPTDWLLCAWRAAPWQFDRAFGVPLYCPQVDYQFFEFAESMEKLAFLCRERGIPYGYSPFGSIDLEHVASAAPVPRRDLAILEDHVILGSIGNHLPKRMSDEFCRMMAGVLRRHPQSTYLVVGPGPFDRQIALFGPELCGGPTPRVRFPGETRVADRVTQTFDIYVNQYPDGGGFSILDAMAASKPVAAMLVGDSFLSRAGADYVGPDHLVRPATDEAFAARLSELIANPQMRMAHGAAMRRRYETDYNGRRWVADMSDRIWKVIHAGA